MEDRILERVNREFESVDGLRVFRISFRRAEHSDCTLRICADSLSDVFAALGSWQGTTNGLLGPQEKGLGIEIDDLGPIQSIPF